MLLSSVAAHQARWRQLTRNNLLRISNRRYRLRVESRRFRVNQAAQSENEISSGYCIAIRPARIVTN